MTKALVQSAIALMARRRFGQALPLLLRSIELDPSRWNVWYMAGQCYRFLDDIDRAIEHLARAAELNSDEAPIFSALGIAYQLRSRWDEAVEAFRRAIEINPDFDLAYNSLALTQKLRGELDKAAFNYDLGVKALARRIVKEMRNSSSSPILKHRDTAGVLWLEYALYGATYLVSCAGGINGVTWPSGEMAMQEERTEEHAGLYWVDVPRREEGTFRFFLPNYFNTFREELRGSGSYATLMGNRGAALELLGQQDDADQHFREADEFSLS